MTTNMTPTISQAIEVTGISASPEIIHKSNRSEDNNSANQATNTTNANITAALASPPEVNSNTIQNSTYDKKRKEP
jgi:hypothetical protein